VTGARPLGGTGVRVSALGVGGHHLGDLPNVETAIRLVHEAIDAGVNFMDNAWEYHEHRSEEWMGQALRGRRDRCAPYAADGHLEMYKSTMFYDGAVGRTQHGFPSSQELPM